MTNPPKYQLGDRVQITRSPYLSVQVGARGTVKLVREDHGGPGQHMYTVSGMFNALFYEWEIRKVEEAGDGAKEG